MRPQQLHDTLQEEFEYPVDHTMVIAQTGDNIVDAPDVTDSETVDEILVSDNDRIYETTGDLVESIYGNLDDSYIGRKYYDDRGANINEGDYEYPHDDQNQSF